jgi:hypothetical protein
MLCVSILSIEKTVFQKKIIIINLLKVYIAGYPIYLNIIRIILIIFI